MGRLLGRAVIFIIYNNGQLKRYFTYIDTGNPTFRDGGSGAQDAPSGV